MMTEREREHRTWERAGYDCSIVRWQDRIGEPALRARTAELKATGLSGIALVDALKALATEATP